MKPLEAIREALGSLRANKLRSFLTMLGVIIGVGAMLLMVAIVEGFQVNIRKQFEGLGSRLVFVFYNPDENARRQARRTFEGLDLLDARTLRARCDLLSSVAAELDIRTTPDPGSCIESGFFVGSSWSPQKRMLLRSYPKCEM